MKKENLKKVLLVLLAIIICIAVYVGVVTIYKNNKALNTNIIERNKWVDRIETHIAVLSTYTC